MAVTRQDARAALAVGAKGDRVLGRAAELRFQIKHAVEVAPPLKPDFVAGCELLAPNTVKRLPCAGGRGTVVGVVALGADVICCRVSKERAGT